ncbi:MAG: hypothetical protein NWS46_11555, partial [Cyclobacteriaceae bacterium]|nr:hypothetical protein [Cyclobacteriaceae bacterium]
MKTKNLLAILIVAFNTIASGQKTEKINITFFGSSVCLGSGAENKQGYAYQFYHNNTIDTTRYK